MALIFFPCFLYPGRVGAAPGLLPHWADPQPWDPRGGTLSGPWLVFRVPRTLDGGLFPMVSPRKEMRFFLTLMLEGTGARGKRPSRVFSG